jgi:hypothetical protein
LWLLGKTTKVKQDISKQKTIVHDSMGLRLVYTFQISKFNNIKPNGSNQDSGNVVKDISIKENLQAVYLQPKGMANHDK